MTFPIHSLVDHLFRRQSAQIVSTLTRALGGRHLDLAEEAVQDALVTALQQWPYRGIPDDPAAWLFRVARNRALDRLRHTRMASDKEALVAERFGHERPADPAETILMAEGVPLRDDQLGMMFLTCHPALPRESRVALTLKIVGGFSVGEIARAFSPGKPRFSSASCAPSGCCARRTCRLARPIPPGSPRGSIRSSKRSI